MRHESCPPELEPLLRVLRDRGIDYIVVGSVAAAIHGAELEAGDLDIVPALDHANLLRLIKALRDLEAQPRGPFGDWTVGDDGEKKWIPRPTTEEDLAAWMPDADDLWTLDHSFLTRLGNFDVVPEIAGTYDTLQDRACTLVCEEVDVRVAHIDEILARLTVPRRKKDIPRVAKLRELQRGLGSEDSELD